MAAWLACHVAPLTVLDADSFQYYPRDLSVLRGAERPTVPSASCNRSWLLPPAAGARASVARGVALIQRIRFLVVDAMISRGRGGRRRETRS